jgi:flavin-binding protein dodecin
MAMQDKTYVITEIVGVSDGSISQAVANAIERANQTLKALDWFELKEVRGTIVNGKVGQYQVTLDVGFRYLTDEEMRAWVQG